jgi:hypothetical protein
MTTRKSGQHLDLDGSKIGSPALAVYRLCLRCGPNIRACEKARGGKTCPAPKMTCASRERRDELVAEWHTEAFNGAHDARKRMNENCNF